MKQSHKLSQTAIIMCKSIGGLFLVLLAAGLLVIWLLFPFEKPLPYAIGLFVGCLLSAAKVVLLERSLERSLDMEGKQAQNYANLQMVLRYTLTGLVVLAVILLPNIVGLFGTIFGILSLQIAAYVTSFVLKDKNDLV